MKDAIIILGGGIDSEGELPDIPKHRIEKGVELFNQKVADFIIMSGKWGFLIPFVPPRQEAEAMTEYAVSLGMPIEKVIKETSSMDTIGNAYFTKTAILEPRKWSSVVVVTSEYHLKRTKYIFNKVLGDHYSIEYISADSQLSSDELKKKETTDEKVLTFTMKHLDKIKDGDDASISAFMKQFPGYSDNPKYSTEELLKLLNSIKA